MTRPIFFFTATTLILLQTAGITSLPGVLTHIPLTIAVATFLLVYRQTKGVWGWMIAQGIVFEVFRLGQGFLGLEVLAHLGALLVSILLSRSVFTNRSFYGLAACAWVSVCTLEFIRFLGITLFHGESYALHTFFWAPLFAMMIVGVLFSTSRLVFSRYRPERV